MAYSADARNCSSSPGFEEGRVWVSKREEPSSLSSLQLFFSYLRGAQQLARTLRIVTLSKLHQICMRDQLKGCQPTAPVSKQNTDFKLLTPNISAVDIEDPLGTNLCNFCEGICSLLILYHCCGFRSVASASLGQLMPRHHVAQAFGPSARCACHVCIKLTARPADGSCSCRSRL